MVDTVSVGKIDVPWLHEYLLGRWAEVRKDSRRLVARPELQSLPDQKLAEQRQRVAEQLAILAEHGGVNRAFPRHLGGCDDHGGNIAGFEELVVADPSLQIKSGVQWGLFGAAVLHLGTEYHHENFLPAIMSLEIPGAFAMTETGHGSDVSRIGTTAQYDSQTEEFIIHTPFRAAWKDYLGNAAIQGRAAVVFAQLIVSNVNYGVHAFYVPIRDANGQFLEGVGGEDDGLKGGLNGIDNGRLHFTQLRIPRRNLLNRYGDVAADGSYSSPIANQGRRFFTMLGTLVQGRVSLDGAAAAAAKIALQIAFRYGSQRRQFAADTHSDERVLLDYQSYQTRLIPLLATTYAATFAHEVLLERFDAVFSGAQNTDADRNDLETLAAALKPLSTWHAIATLQEAREACGGAGFLAENRLTGLRADLDIYVTFEGDNHVLLQLVAKRLLADYARKMSDPDLSVVAKHFAAQAADRTVNGTGLRRLAQNVSDLGFTARSVDQLRAPETQRYLLTDRVETMIAQIASQLRSAQNVAKDEAATLINSQQNTMIDAAKAHAELLQWEAFTEALHGVEHAETATVLRWLRDLFGFGLIQKNLAWYLMNGRLSPQRAQAVEAYRQRLIGRLRSHAPDLANAFGYTQEHLRATITTDAEQKRYDEAQEYYRDLQERGLAPTEEKVPQPKKARFNRVG